MVEDLIQHHPALDLDLRFQAWRGQWGAFVQVCMCVRLTTLVFVWIQVCEFNVSLTISLYRFLHSSDEDSPNPAINYEVFNTHSTAYTLFSTHTHTHLFFPLFNSVVLYPWVQLVLRKWSELLPGGEFRCFIKENKLIGKYCMKRLTHHSPLLSPSLSHIHRACVHLHCSQDSVASVRAVVWTEDLSWELCVCVFFRYLPERLYPVLPPHLQAGSPDLPLHPGVLQPTRPVSVPRWGLWVGFSVVW